MSKLERQLREDRLLRDAAKTLFDADLARVKADLDETGVGKRAALRAKDGAAEMLDRASDTAGSNLGILAGLAGAIILWFARNPILALFSPEDDAPESPETPSGDTP